MLILTTQFNRSLITEGSGQSIFPQIHEKTIPAHPAPRPPMHKPPPVTKQPLVFSPLRPQNRGAPPIQLGSLLAKMQKMEVEHTENLRDRDRENHYLRCQLGVAGAEHL